MNNCIELKQQLFLPDDGRLVLTQKTVHQVKLKLEQLNAFSNLVDQEYKYARKILLRYQIGVSCKPETKAILAEQIQNKVTGRKRDRKLKNISHSEVKPAQGKSKSQQHGMILRKRILKNNDYN